MKTGGFQKPLGGRISFSSLQNLSSLSDNSTQAKVSRSPLALGGEEADR